MAPCIWCQEERSTLLLERRDRLGSERFSYLRCDRCGVIRLDPQPPEERILRYYPPTYEAYLEPHDNWLLRLGRRRGWVRRIKGILRYLPVPVGSVLDVGCATGEFLEMMQQRGWRITGIEPDPQAAGHAWQRLGTGAIRQARLEEVSFPEASFDLVTLWDVLEHLYDPPQTLRRLASWLSPEGVLALGVPDPESWDARWFGRFWNGWDAPRHLFIFPEKVLEAMSAAAGLQVVGSACLYGDYGSFILSLNFLLREALAAPALWWLANLRLWRYLLWPYFRLAEWRGRGPVRTFLCRRVNPGGTGQRTPT